MNNPDNKATSRLDELIKQSQTGYPKPIYDDSQVTLQYWKTNASNELVLFIPKNMFTQREAKLYWDCPDGRPSIYLKLPNKNNSRILWALSSCGCREDLAREIVVLEHSLMVYLEDEIAQGIGELLEETGCPFSANIYGEFKTAHIKDMEAVDEMYYKSLRCRPVHPNIVAVKQELKEIESRINAFDLDSDDCAARQKALEILSDKHCLMFEKCSLLLKEIPTDSGSREEDEARCEIQRWIEELQKKRSSKLEELKG